MIGESQGTHPVQVRHVLARALVLAFCVAGFTAIAAILSGDFGETEGRVIALSLGFAVFSATASSGASLRFQRSDYLRALGLGTIGLSATGFLLLAYALWTDGTNDAWLWFASVGLAALAGSHTSLVTRARRSSDSTTVRAVATASIFLGLVDTAMAIAVINSDGDIDEGVMQLGAVLVVLLMLTTSLTPILRRLRRSPTPPASPSVHGSGVPPESRTTDTPKLGRENPVDAQGSVAMEILAAVARIETLNADAGNRAPEIQRECERLRVLAHERIT